LIASGFVSPCRTPGWRALKRHNFTNGIEEFPETAVVEVGDFKVGVVHGHQCIPWGDESALLRNAGKLGVDILVSGHTHKQGIVNNPGQAILINPGSVTGAASPLGEYDISPSFMLMALSGGSLNVYTYEEVEGEAKVTMTELKK